MAALSTAREAQLLKPAGRSTPVTSVSGILALEEVGLQVGDHPGCHSETLLGGKGGREGKKDGWTDRLTSGSSSELLN